MAAAFQKPGWTNARYLTPVALSGVAFAVDVATPHGVIDGFLYVLAVLTCVWVPNVAAAPYTAFGLMPTMVLGYVLSPMGVPVPVAIVNMLVGAVTVWIAAVIVRQRARSSQEREELLVQIRNLQRKSVNDADAERAEVSRWLHEGIGQELAAIGWGLDSIVRRAADDQQMRAEARQLRIAVDAAQRTIHGRAAYLRNLQLDAKKLGPWIEQHVANLSARAEIQIALSGLSTLTMIADGHAELCFRIVQEALTNVVKHAGASRASIEFQFAAKEICTLITDDGKGMSDADRRKPDSLGLRGLEERLLMIGGTLTVQSIAPSGTQLKACIPTA